MESRNRKVLERTFNRRGLAYMEVNEVAAAVSDFTVLIKLNPTIAGYFDNRPNAFKALGNLKAALLDANVAVRLAPTYSIVYRSRGNILDAMEHYSDAIADYNTAIEIAPIDAGLYIDRGKILTKIEHIRKAIEDFSQALSLNSKAITALRERGLAHKALGNYHAALADLTLFLTFEPSDRETILALQEMQESRMPPTTTGRPKTHTPEDQEIERSRGDTSGSGFFVSRDGHIVTNAHVVADCRSVQVGSRFPAGTFAQVLARDRANDLALLKSNLHPDAAASLRGGVRAGEGVAAFGFPLTGLLSTGGNITFGNVSSVSGLGDILDSYK